MKYKIEKKLFFFVFKSIFHQRCFNSLIIQVEARWGRIQMNEGGNCEGSHIEIEMRIQIHRSANEKWSRFSICLCGERFFYFLFFFRVTPCWHSQRVQNKERESEKNHKLKTY